MAEASSERRLRVAPPWDLRLGERIPTLTRFVLFLLIPLGFWLSGAFAERALSAVLD